MGYRTPIPRMKNTGGTNKCHTVYPMICGEVILDLEGSLDGLSLIDEHYGDIVLYWIG